ncbi:MAG TPA: PEGA domain-containing protein, partial [Candidatus Udaeobacter sp.]|nr:PEGA domain-containing protein [Candidatus Udaeobacter sp.]
ATGPGVSDLVPKPQPWQRVVTGAVATKAPTAAQAAETADPAAFGEGRIEARTEPFLANVTVTVDGKAIGKAPVSLDGITAGKHLVGFDGGNGRRWEEEVNVIPNEVAVAVAPLGPAETKGLVQVIATRMNNDGPSDEEVRVEVDGEVKGATPLDMTLEPGTHAVALDLGGRVVYRVIEVRAGDKQVLDVPVDAPPPFVIEHKAPANLAGDGTVILTVQVTGPSAVATYLNLHVEERGAFRPYPMGPVPGAPGTYAVGLPVTRELHGKRLRYYFATAAEGESPVVTKIFTVPLR